jgi:hypothetical protein
LRINHIAIRDLLTSRASPSHRRNLFHAAQEIELLKKAVADTLESRPKAVSAATAGGLRVKTQHKLAARPILAHRDPPLFFPAFLLHHRSTAARF